MRRVIFALTAIVLIVSEAGVRAQLAWVAANALRGTGEPGGAYHSKNRLRVFVAFDFGRLSSPEQTLVAKAANMASAKGFARIGVTTSRCMTTVVLGTPRSTACYLLATMLTDADVAAPEGKEPVRYYRVSDVLRAEAASAPPPTVPVVAPIIKGPATSVPIQPSSAWSSPTALPRTNTTVPQQSAAEIERATLQAASATNGGNGVIVY